MNKVRIKEKVGDIIAHSGVILFFIVAFEIMIMISPFAFFFYSVFNPIFKWLESYPATAWLTNFYLPHMIMPPTLFLKSVRILGSVCFVIGSLSFFTCAFQVYIGKIFKWGIAEKGLYKIIRHPQYFSLGVWGVGMAILWPRFIVLASLALMFVLYYFLAMDEERRMTAKYGDSYKAYIKDKGMFFPKFIERNFGFHGKFAGHALMWHAIVSSLVFAVVLGTGFALRHITLASLSYESRNNITLISILPEDNQIEKNVLNGIFGESIDFLQPEKDYLGYVMTPDYIMQGMIADTGNDCKLFKQHHTFAMITDWIINPFEHLRRSPSASMAKMHGVDPEIARKHHCPLQLGASLNCKTCPYKRVIFVEIDHPDQGHICDEKLFGFSVRRTPVGFIDINSETGQTVNIKRVTSTTTAWQDVPTPAI